jgi:hypothetical protein
MCNGHWKRGASGSGLLHRVKPLELDACICGGKLPTDGAHAVIALLLPLLNALKKLLNRVNALIDGLPG